MSSKRPRDSVSGSALAKDIRTTLEDTSTDYEIESRTKYIKQQLDNMTEDQLTRFEFFVRSHLPRARVKDILTNALTANSKYTITDEMAIVVSGLAKLFVGEITEIATDVLKESGGENGIQVEHIEEAYRRLQQDGKIGSMPDRSYLFSRESMVVNDLNDADLFDEDAENLDALLEEPSGGDSGSSTRIAEALTKDDDGDLEHESVFDTVDRLDRSEEVMNHEE